MSDDRCACGARIRHKCVRHGGHKMCAKTSDDVNISMDFEKKLTEDQLFARTWGEEELRKASEYFKKFTSDGD